MRAHLINCLVFMNSKDEPTVRALLIVIATIITGHLMDTCDI